MIITLSNTTITAKIDSIGAQLISLTDASGQEYIWQRNPDIWPRCSPLLFPAIGNSRNDKTIIEGITYHMPKHGFCKETDFEVSHLEDASVTLMTTDHENTKTMYPYKFSLSLTYSLTKDGLSIAYTVENRDDRTICYFLGAHPGFNCPLKSGESFEDYQLEFEHKETLSAMVYDLKNLQFNREHRIPLLHDDNVLPLNYHLFEHDAIYFDKLESRNVSIIHPITRHGVEVSYPDFSSVAFWTPFKSKPPFLCVEPWNGSAICSDEDDHFEHKHDAQHLACGAFKTYHLGIRIL